MHRFHLESSSAPSLQIGSQISLPENTSHQIRNVLRLHPGEKIAIFTGDGREWTAELASIEVTERGSQPVAVHLSGVSEPNVEMKTHVAMVMALTRPQRYELALAKCTELGASEFLPVLTDRVLKSDLTIGENRMARWNRIVLEAAELSGRVRVPPIADPESMNSVLARLSDDGATSILLWEGAREPMLADLLATLRSGSQPPYKLALVFGPVGGFAPEEAQRATDIGADIASLGNRILRTETASIAAMSITAQILR